MIQVMVGTGCSMVTMWLKLVSSSPEGPSRAQHGVQIDSGTKVMVTREGSGTNSHVGHVMGN